MARIPIIIPFRLSKPLSLAKPRVRAGSYLSHLSHGLFAHNALYLYTHLGYNKHKLWEAVGTFMDCGRKWDHAR